MIRFANPGSDIDGFTRIFQALVEVLEQHQPFSLDQISEALVAKGLATSSGFMGPQALERSTRDDRSRDPLYNQSKMYSELFRLLGWIHPIPESRLSFRFTWLGLHVKEAGSDAKKLVTECVLGIAFPNEVVEARGDYRLRPFATILRSMALLDGIMCRDEMIAGPLCLLDDTDPTKFAGMVERLRRLRGNGSRLEAALDKIAEDRGIQRNTMMNYTRFPLAVLEWSGWTTKERIASVYGRPVVFHRLTGDGRKQVEWIAGATDLRADQVTQLAADAQEAACRRAVIRMLDRSGFDAEALRADVDRWTATLVRSRVIPASSKELLFSPFQEMPTTVADRLFGTTTGTERHLARAGAARGRHAAQSGRSGGGAMAVRLRPGGASSTSGGGTVAGMLKALATKHGNRSDAVVDELMRTYENASKADFYPLIAGLFACLGFNSTASRVGVNYARWDAIIQHPTDSVSIEIKSPAEERSVSVKAVRQALENKVILMARRPFPTRASTTSLAVGYYLPNDRAEVGDLIADIHSAFGMSVGVVDLRSLATLAVGVVVDGKTPDHEALLNLRGFIDVVNA